MTQFPGYNYAGVDQPGGMEENITGKAPPRFPITSEDEQSGGWVNADGFVRYMFVRDAKFDSLKFTEQALRQAHPPRFRRCSTRPIPISRRSSIAAAS